MNRSLKTLLPILALMFSLQTSAQQQHIDMDELRDKIAGAWIGQMVGNIYGLPFENKFVDAPGNEADFPYGYSKNLAKLAEYKGAFSDDDTDVEYLYLTLMEKYGSEPTYGQIREGWMYHIRDRVWLANRATLGLMHHGFTPPFTGSAELNPHWYQIDPQLINEIWAYTAPGMTAYAAAKSEWAARITSDGWATSPTVHYGAMYANAFFEKNITKLITNALDQLPQDDRYAEVVREVLELHRLYPDSWQKAREVIAKKYYIEEDEMTKTIWNANLNGACGLLSLLYGNGDWQLTMDIGCAAGFDCDNQTATIGGILGVMYGASAIPTELTLPIEGWEKPFNDRYINITRYDMPDAAISDMIDRTVNEAVKIACAQGGRIVKSKRGDRLQINTRAKFEAPLEFCIGPMPRIEAGQPVEYSFACVTNSKYAWALTKGKLPEGLTFTNGNLLGTTSETGKFPITLSLSNGRETLSKEFLLLARNHNIAPQADSILTNVRRTNTDVLYRCWITFGKPMYANDVAVINDGVVNGAGSVFYSLAAEADIPKIDFFGYEWNEPHTINMMALHTGCMEEFGGWFSSLNIQYRDENGRWHDVGNHTTTPALPATDDVFIQPHFVEYVFEFEPVTTKAIRVLCDTKVQPHWNKATQHTSAFTSITELSVYEK